MHTRNFQVFRFSDLRSFSLLCPSLAKFVTEIEKGGFIKQGIFNFSRISNFEQSNKVSREYFYICEILPVCSVFFRVLFLR